MRVLLGPGLLGTVGETIHSLADAALSDRGLIRPAAQTPAEDAQSSILHEAST